MRGHNFTAWASARRADATSARPPHRTVLPIWADLFNSRLIPGYSTWGHHSVTEHRKGSRVIEGSAKDNHEHLVRLTRSYRYRVARRIHNETPKFSYTCTLYMVTSNSHDNDKQRVGLVPGSGMISTNWLRPRGTGIPTVSAS